MEGRHRASGPRAHTAVPPPLPGTRWRCRGLRAALGTHQRPRSGGRDVQRKRKTHVDSWEGAALDLQSQSDKTLKQHGTQRQKPAVTQTNSQWPEGCEGLISISRTKKFPSEIHNGASPAVSVTLTKQRGQSQGKLNELTLNQLRLS